MVEEPQAEYQRIPKKVSLETYLTLIDDGTKRLEYHDGEVIDIQSATEQHGKICTNLTRLIGNCLLDKPCDLYAADRPVWIEACNKSFFPDHVIVCDEHEFIQLSKNVKATVNPSVVIEVLSDSTGDFDQTTKTRCYKKLKSLRQIIYVSQDEKYIRTLIKTENERIWNEIEYFEDDEKVPIGDCKITFKDIYHRVIFDNQPEQASDF
jgi:Uma2 family endonuclease